MQVRHLVAGLKRSVLFAARAQVLSAKGELPAESYGYFMELLARTVRNEIASCCEKAYVKLSVRDARKLLMLASDAEVEDFAAINSWTLREGVIYFQPEVVAELGAKCVVPHHHNYSFFRPYLRRRTQELTLFPRRRDINSTDLISSCLTYAKELERIV